MKEALYRFLIWCSGTDPDVIENAPRSEQIKHATFGMLVCIPSVLGLVSMSYAISTLVNRPSFYLSLGILWAGIIFIVDRFLVSTFRKSGNIWNDVRSVAFITRIVFASFIGVVVAHPLVLLYFNDRILEQLQDEKRGNIQEIKDKYQRLKDPFQSATLATTNSIATEYGLLNCLKQLLTYEQAGIEKELPCGASSGKAGHAFRAQELENQISSQEAKIRTLENNSSTEKLTNDAKETNLDGLMARELNDTLNYSQDYLSREIALGNLAKEHPGPVNSVKWFLIIFFIFVDILPVLWKGTTKKGPYDDSISLIEFESDTTFRVRRNLLEAEVIATHDFSIGSGREIFRDSAELKQKTRSDQDSIRTIFESESYFINKMTKEHLRFGKWRKKRIKRIAKISDEMIRNNEMILLDQITESFYASSQKAHDQHTNGNRNTNENEFHQENIDEEPIVNGEPAPVAEP